MAGLYVHIPFCRKACNYCDFHFTVSLKNKKELLSALFTEFKLRKEFIGNEPINTIYLGGGTPSVLNIDELTDIFKNINNIYDIAGNPEITIETNPDDMSMQYISMLKNYTPVNRLSIGVQSFIDPELVWLNRRHNAVQAVKCIDTAHNAGFNNINIDLIYGLPISSENNWLYNIKKAVNMNIQHISAYHLTIEQNSIFGRKKTKGLIKEMHENDSARQFEILLDITAKYGFEHYEISNFAKPDYFSRHNANYWNGGRYIGCGPSAHSYNGTERYWNINVNTKYINSLNNNMVFYEKEVLTSDNRYNEYILTGIRTKWGIDKTIILKNYGGEYLEIFNRNIKKYLISGDIVQNNETYTLTPKGKFIADRIACDLFA